MLARLGTLGKYAGNTRRDLHRHVCREYAFMQPGNFANFTRAGIAWFHANARHNADNFAAFAPDAPPPLARLPDWKFYPDANEVQVITKAGDRYAIPRRTKAAGGRGRHQTPHQWSGLMLLLSGVAAVLPTAHADIVSATHSAKNANGPRDDFGQDSHSTMLLTLTWLMITVLTVCYAWQKLKAKSTPQCPSTMSVEVQTDTFEEVYASYLCTAYGERYHVRSSCPGLRRATTATWRTPCAFCIRGGETLERAN